MDSKQRVATIRTGLAVIFLAILIPMLGLIGWAKATGASITILQTASMSPSMTAGSLAIIKPAQSVTQFSQGEMIGFQQNGAASTVKIHRVHDIVDGTNGREIHTKGDATTAIDPETVSDKTPNIYKIVFFDHSLGYLWRFIPFLLGGILVAYFMTYFADTRFGATVIAIVMLSVVINGLGMKIVSPQARLEIVDTVTDADGIATAHLINTGLIPLRISSPNDSITVDQVVVEPSKPVALTANSAEAKVELAAEPEGNLPIVSSWRLLLLESSPVVISGMAALISILLMRVKLRHRRDS